MKAQYLGVGFAVWVTVIFSAIPANSAELVSNGGFETLTGCNPFNQCTGAPPWGFTGAANGAYGGEAYSGNGYAFLATTPGDNNSNGTGPGTASEIVDVPTSGLYSLSFFYSVQGNLTGDSVFELSASVGGQTLFSSNVFNATYSEAIATVDLSAGPNTIEFSGTPISGNLGDLALDDVSLAQTPLPASLFLMVAGVFVVAAFAARHHGLTSARRPSSSLEIC